MPSERPATRFRDILDNIARIEDHVRGMGNHLRHAYDLVEPRILWNTIRRELPQLKQTCQQALARLQD